MNVRAFAAGGFRALVLAGMVAGGIAVGLWMNRSTVPEEHIKNTIITTLQREADTAVVVTGYVDLSANVTLSDTRYFPAPEHVPWYAVPLFQAAGAPKVSLGTNRTTLRVPGRISYGFAIDRVAEDDIRVTPDHRIHIRLPELDIYSAEPELAELTRETELGWARWSSSGRQLEQRALSRIQSAMRRQGRRHLQDSSQPYINTTRALEALLTPALRAAGVTDPTFEFHAASPPVTIG